MPEPVREACPFLVDPVIYLVLFYFFYRFWVSSLNSCIGDVPACYHSNTKAVNFMQLQSIIAFVFLYLILVRAYFTPIWFYKIWGVVLVAGTVFYIKKTSNGISWADHSMTNMVVANAALLGMVTASALLLASYKLYRYNKKAWYIVKTLLLLFITYLFFVRVVFSCSHL